MPSSPRRSARPIHLRIGRLLLASLSAEEVREKLFDVVSQLNAGVELIADPEERHRLARLNAEAGWKAQASTAHRSAVAYLRDGLRSSSRRALGDGPRAGLQGAVWIRRAASS